MPRLGNSTQSRRQLRGRDLSRRTVLAAGSAAVAGAIATRARAESQAGVCTFGIFPYVPALKVGDLFAPLALELSRALGVDIQLRTKETFERFAHELAVGSYDIVLVHPFLYVDAHERQAYQAIARLDEELRAVIVSRRTETVASLAALRGQTVALPPRLSGVSYLLRLAMLDEGLAPGVDLHLTYHQTKVSCLHAVAAGDAVGCVVPSFLGAQLPAMREMKLQPIWSSPPITSLLVAVHPRLPAAAVDRLRTHLVALRGTDGGRRLLESLAWPGLVRADDHDYARIRALADRLRASPSG
jgi:phosphonate transport system substrate-binding protein